MIRRKALAPKLDVDTVVPVEFSQAMDEDVGFS